MSGWLSSNKSFDKVVQELVLKPLCTASRILNGAAQWKTVWCSPKLRVASPYDAAILLLEVHPTERKAGSQRALARVKQKGGSAQKPVHGCVAWLNKMHVNEQNVSRPWGNSDTCYHMDELWGHYTKWNEPVTKKDKFHRFHMNTECGQIQSRCLPGVEGKNEEFLLTWYRI